MWKWLSIQYDNNVYDFQTVSWGKVLPLHLNFNTMFGLFNKETKRNTFWESLTEEAQLDNYVKESHKYPIVLFKHSTRCSISHMAKARLENGSTEGLPKMVYLDLIGYRSVSNAIAKRFDIEHQSPQIIVLHNGKPIYNASHGAINRNDLTQYGV